MTQLHRARSPRRVLFCLVVGLGVQLSACATTDPNVAQMEQTVTPMTVGEVADVSADDLAKAMLTAGFTAEQVLKHGPAVRNSLATSGGAQIRDGKFVAALFSIHSRQLYVTSRARGTFVQPLAPAG